MILVNYGKLKVLTLKQDHALVRRAKAGDAAARKLIVERNMGIVVREAKKYQSRWNEFEDLVQEGMVGLLTAVEGFDAKRGLRFSTYATFWVRAKILFNLKGANKPSGKLNGRWKAFQASEKKLEAAGVVPTDERMAAVLKVPVIDVRRFRDFYGIRKPTLFSSLTLVSDDGNESSFEARLPDPRQSPEETVSHDQELESRKHALDYALACVDKRSRSVIKRRFLKEDPDTLAEVGRDLGVSRERVRQIQNEARRKIAKVVLARCA